MPTRPRCAFPRIRLGVSACLLGERVRYDGGHKRHPFLTGALAAHADYLPLCPEAGIGMGVPRPPIHLVGGRDQPRALGLENPALDVTADLTAYGEQALAGLQQVSGYIFKKNSPSCGLRGVKLCARPGRNARRIGTGIFARVVRDALPLLPLAEEDTLDDPRRRDNFLCRVYVYRRWQDLQARGLSRETLGEFHAAHRYLVIAHSRVAHARLEKLLGDATAARMVQTTGQYIGALMTTLTRTIRRSQHHGILHQLAEELAPFLGKHQQTELADTLKAWEAGGLSLAETVSALRALAAHHPEAGLSGQVYLHPYPDALRCDNY